MSKYLTYLDVVRGNGDIKNIQNIQKWVETTLANHLEKNPEVQDEIEHILDYMTSPEAPVHTERMSYDEAKSNAEKWNKSQQKKGKHIKELPEDTKLVHDFGDGFRIVQLIGENAYKREGFLMNHCVSSYYGKGKEIYSLRDKDNMPHCTMEKDQQIKGKGNGNIHPKYIEYIVKFLENTGMTVGESEMRHLGYIKPYFTEFVKNKLYLGKYVRENETVEYNDDIIIFDDWKKLLAYNLTPRQSSGRRKS